MSKRRKERKHPFVRGMVIYAVVFLAVLAAGLAVFWDFMESYEASRPKNTMDAFVEQLTAEQMYDYAAGFVAELDGNLQDREEICRVVAENMTEKISYAKKSSECTEDRQVYVLRSGSREIGQVAITAGEPDVYGARVWSVSEMEFRFPHLVGSGATITVPEGYTVSVSGTRLDGNYVSEENIPYPALAEFQGQFDMPELMTYQVGSYLGTCEFTVTDHNGQIVAVTEDMNWDPVIQTCTEEEEAELETLALDFVQKYVTFTGSRKNVQSHYSKLAKLMVSGGDLAQRLMKAIDGMQYAQSAGDSVVDFQVNQCVRISEERYMCDVTYVLQTITKNGTVEADINMKIVFLETQQGLKVEAIANY